MGEISKMIAQSSPVSSSLMDTVLGATFNGKNMHYIIVGL